MKTMSTLPQTFYAVTCVFEGRVYSEITGPYSRHHDALNALNRLNRNRRGRDINYSIIKTDLVWVEDSE